MFQHAPSSHPHAAAQPSWRPLARACALAVLGMASSLGAQAENLIDLYQSARGYDAAFLAAKSQFDAAQFKADQARSLQRPSVNLQATVKRNRLESSLPDTPNGFGGTTSYDSTSTNSQLAVAARQPLFNMGNAAKVSQAEASLNAAQADLKMAEDDLVARLAQGYFNVLAAQDVLATAKDNKKALAEQLASAKRSFEVGNSTITDTREAQARFDLATAQEIAATNDLRVKHIALDQLVGRADVKPNPLRTPVNLETLDPGQIDPWVQNTGTAPMVRKAEVGLKVAQLEVDNARAGHMPTLDAVAQVARTHIDSTNALAKAQSGAGTAGSIGLEFNMPLYAGHAIQNRVRETLSLQDKAERDLDNARRSVELGTRQAYSGVQSGLAQVKAYEAAESSAKLALEATQLGYRVGVRINKDVLDAQTQLTNTQKDLYKARYDVIIGAIKLRQAAGTLTANDLAELNKLVAP
ncbi:MAG: channel protein TolC [Burkholderiales bacterium RIFCSPLOWO2_12_FULL_64_99]|uniref:TolC family outer membrane protein n=1 Tax=Aquabacterium sp. TaxID=1872578 RepID=UPI0008C10C77|nr:TolC family outer membrane protein [Aquabacterium sp.]OGB04018.1 MAG: channel protein TolC [Burkholderiales bacterium RIFCSPHIGHO2_12_FULL_63_20]OGB66734.1 MAG: channel protein TolC [Burkholderiales bacterium RIFCSPLOWO2_12_FULL_64_99]